MAVTTLSAARDLSLDSVIFTLESNFSSLFSSTSASVNRCSFVSDAGYRGSLYSEFRQHLAGLDSGGGGPDLDPPLTSNNHVPLCSHLSRKIEKAKVRKEEDNINKVVLHLDDFNDDDDEFEALDSHSARNSFSIALKECQDRRSRSEALTKKLHQCRPASLDLNKSVAHGMSSSPRLGVMNKAAAVEVVSSHKPENLPSPGTPNYCYGTMEMSKGWSSERMPLSTNGNRRQAGAALLPFNNGRALPSKWEDAERWIFSPVAGDGVARPSTQHPQRQPKSKSGPLWPPGMSYNSLYSSPAPMYDGGYVNSLIAGSPFPAGLITANGLSIRGCGGDGQSFANVIEPCIARSASVHGCTDLVCQSSLSSSQDDKIDDVKDAAANVSHVVSRRDMATQMSPDSSLSPPRQRSSFFPSTSSILPIVEVQSLNSTKPEVRDVQVDERVTLTRWSRKSKARIPGKASEDVDKWKLKAVEPRSSSWEVSETIKSISMVKREEAKITAWENLQKAKAEAAIRKLEMKLEKKRSSSMDKIMKKLQSAQNKAQKMRSSVVANPGHQVSETSFKALSFRRTRQMGSLAGCFTCHAF